MIFRANIQSVWKRLKELETDENTWLHTHTQPHKRKPCSGRCLSFVSPRNGSHVTRFTNIGRASSMDECNDREYKTTGLGAWWKDASMQNKKEGLRAVRRTNLHVTYRETSEAAEASGNAIQPSTSHPRCIFSPVPSISHPFSLVRPGSLENPPAGRRTCISR